MTACEQLLNNLEKENRQFRKLLALQQRLGGTQELPRLLPLVISEISDLLEAERSTIFLIDWDHMELQALYAEGLARDELTIKLKMGIVGWSALSRREVSIANASDHPYFNPEIDQILGYKTESIMVAPISDRQGELSGALELLNKDTGVFTEKDLETLRRETRRLGMASNLAEMDSRAAAQLLTGLAAEVNCERGSLFRVDRSTGQLISIYAQGLDNANIRLSLNLGVAGLVAVTGEVLNIRDTGSDPRFDATIDQRTGYTTRNILGLPIRNHQRELLGVIEIINKRHGSFDEHDILIMDGLSSIVSIAIDNAMMLDEQEKQFRSIVEVMAASIDAKDTLTAGHSAQVTGYAVGIARELGFTGNDLEVISLAGLLHDYGKLGVEDRILKKPGRLTAEEYAQIQEHVALTRTLLKKMRFARKYRNVPLVAAAHHEYLDGSGYDSGMTGRKIPFMAKIITVADVFDALTSQRHYRQAMPVSAAIAQLELEAGIKYEPIIVAALKNYLKKASPPRPAGPDGNDCNGGGDEQWR